MKRQPIASAAAFFVLRLLWVEIHRARGEGVDSSAASTDGIFCQWVLYYPIDKEV